MARNDDDSNNRGDQQQRPKLDKEMQRQLKERKEEMLLFGRFRQIAANRLEAMTRQSEESGIKYKMGDEEKQVFRQMQGMGIYEGIAAGIVTFFVLRRGPIYIGRWVYKRRLAQQQANGGVHPHGTTPPPADGYQFSNPHSKNPFQVAQRPDFPRSRNFFLRSIWFAFDSMLSLMMAASVSMAYTDTEKIRTQMLELPLVQGRSLTADALCDDIVKELNKVKREKNPAYQRLTKLKSQGEDTPAAFYMDGIIDFAANCERRRYVEHRLREEQGLSSDEPVEITERISSDAPRLTQNSDGDDEVQETQADGTFMDSDFQDISWDEATDFSADFEDEKRK